MTLYLIWSHEHGGWWRPARMGYTRDPYQAGRYLSIEALKICADAIPGTAQRFGALTELPVREDDLDTVLWLHNQAYGVLDLGPDAEAAPGFKGTYPT